MYQSNNDSLIIVVKDLENELDEKALIISITNTYIIRRKDIILLSIRKSGVVVLKFLGKNK